jgi:hypothetical protein
LGKSGEKKPGPEEVTMPWHPRGKELPFHLRRQKSDPPCKEGERKMVGMRILFAPSPHSTNVITSVYLHHWHLLHAFKPRDTHTAARARKGNPCKSSPLWLACTNPQYKAALHLCRSHESVGCIPSHATDKVSLVAETQLGERRGGKKKKTNQPLRKSPCHGKQSMNKQPPFYVRRQKSDPPCKGGKQQQEHSNFWE